MKSRQLIRAAGVVLIAAAASCKNDSLDPDGGSVASVVITPSTATVAVGATVPLTAEVLDAAGQVIPGRKVVWVSSDADIATVSSNGEVTGRAVGDVQIAASAEGKNAIAQITVNPTPVASVRLSPTSQDLLVGQTVQLVAEPLDIGGAVLPGRPVIFSSSNETAATVSSAGLVTALAAGSAIITAASEAKTAVATITVSAVPVAAVVVTPTENPLVVGQTAQLSAVPQSADGQPLAGRPVLWATSEPSVASVSSTGLVTAIAPGNATISATSEGKIGSASVAVSPKPVSAVVVSPGQTSVLVGASVQLTAQVTDEQGNVLPGRPIAYSSSATHIATVSATGLVTGVAPGSATITATSEGKTGTATVTVNPIPVSTVTVAPPEPNVVLGGQVQLTATARSATGQILSGRAVSWTSGAPSIAPVSGDGVVTGASIGTAIVFATIDGVIGTATVTVRQVPVATVTISPPTAEVVAGGTVQLSASVRDGNGAELPGRLVGWSSSDDATATVSSTGLVSGIKAGTVTITASSEGKSGTATVTVTPPAPAPVASVVVTPSTATVIAGQTTTLQARTLDANGGELTGRAVSWSSDNPGVANVSQSGVVTGVAPGTATITATSEGKSGTAAITVDPAPPAPVATVTVSPETVNLTTGGTRQISVTLRDAQGNELSGRTVTWQTGNAAVATVSDGGLITAAGPGTTTVTATSEGKIGTVTVNVAAPVVGSVTVNPPAATLTVAQTVTLTATVRDEGGATVSGASVSWSSDKPLTAAVSQSGVVTGLLPGTATITASSGGKTGTATITVQLIAVGSVSVTPGTLNLRDRQGERTGQLTATVRDVQGNVLTDREVAWASSNTRVAVVNQTGLVTAQDRGDATITATSEGKSGSAIVRVRN
ncbi:MAG TPA: Ig-like domain-containing protein [Gemmatimonadaceae bacterium]|nr:Ig-like domain-containing protein [Gemmatimonadaceae bacterium]